MRPRPTAWFASVAALALVGLALWPNAGVAIALPTGPRVPNEGAAAAETSAPSAATTSASREDTRLPATLASAVVITVVDADSRQPVSAADVTWSSTQTRGQAITAGDGTVTVSPPPGGPCELTIRSAGRVRLDATLPAVAHAPTVAIERAGDLTVTIRDGDGAPMSGVAVALLPPRLVGGFGGDFVQFAAADVTKAPGPRAVVLPELVLVDGVFRLPNEPVAADRQWHIGARWHGMVRRQTTGEDGTAVWIGIPAGTDYRFGFLPPHQGITEPPHEQQRLTPGPAGVTVGRAAPHNLSGAFAITAGERTDVRGTILRAGRLRGRMLAPPAMRVPARLFAITQAGGGDIAPVIALDVADSQPTDDTGTFVFEVVRPGDYVLRTCWIEGGRDVRFISVTLRMPPGGDIDLGALAPTTGHTVEVAIGMQTTGGRDVITDKVFADPTRALATLMLTALPASGMLADALHEVSIVPVGVPITFHGVPPGRVQVTARSADGIAMVADVANLRASSTIDEPLPLAGQARPCLQVEFGHQIAIECHGEDGTAREPAWLWSRSRLDNRIDGHDLRATGPAVWFGDGGHELFLSMQHGDLRECAVVTLSDADRRAAALSIEVQAAATVRGRLVDTGGHPVAGVQLRWTLPGWASDQAPWLFVATSNAAGEFVLEGVPTALSLQPASDTPALPPLVRGRNIVTLISLDSRE
jgi:hypothetical protein